MKSPANPGAGNEINLVNLQYGQFPSLLTSHLALKCRNSGFGDALNFRGVANPCIRFLSTPYWKLIQLEITKGNSIITHHVCGALRSLR